MIGWLADSIAGRAFGSLTQFGKDWLASRNERRRILAEMQGDIVRAEVRARMAATELLIAEQGWWVTRSIRPAFAAPLIIYWALIVADSIFQFEWDIAALPEPMATWSGWIVAAYFAGRPVEKVGTAIVRAVAGRGR